MKQFAGQTIEMKEIYDAHHVDTRYILRNYKDALNDLEENGKITADPPMDERRKVKGKTTFADDVVVTFPKRDS